MRNNYCQGGALVGAVVSIGSSLALLVMGAVAQIQHEGFGQQSLLARERAVQSVWSCASYALRANLSERLVLPARVYGAEGVVCEIREAQYGENIRMQILGFYAGTVVRVVVEYDKENMKFIYE